MIGLTRCWHRVNSALVARMTKLFSILAKIFVWPHADWVGIQKKLSRKDISIQWLVQVFGGSLGATASVNAAFVATPNWDISCKYSLIDQLLLNSSLASSPFIHAIAKAANWFRFDKCGIKSNQPSLITWLELLLQKCKMCDKHAFCRWLLKVCLYCVVDSGEACSHCLPDPIAIAPTLICLHRLWTFVYLHLCFLPYPNSGQVVVK